MKGKRFRMKGRTITFYSNRKRRKKRKPIHYVLRSGYYLCIKAIGNGICGLATRNKKLVTCKNCLRALQKE